METFEMVRSIAMSLTMLLSGLAWAQPPRVDSPEAARAAVAAVDRFHAALSTGDLTQAGAELDPDVIVLESGGAEHSAAEYLGHHASDDAKFLQAARQKIVRRTARVSGQLAWVASESELNVQKDAGPVTILSDETMVLRSTGEGWKIVHIHWSSTVRK